MNVIERRIKRLEQQTATIQQTAAIPQPNLSEVALERLTTPELRQLRFLHRRREDVGIDGLADDELCMYRGLLDKVRA